MKYPVFALLAVAALLAACKPDLDRRYMDTSLGKALELPPDLARYESESSFDLPQGVGTGAGTGNAGSATSEVLPQIDKMQLEGRGDLYWLHVEEPVDTLYKKIRNFWANEGYGLVIDEPLIGVMQTEWIYTEQGVDKSDASWWELLFSEDDLSAAQDQFHTRVERDDSGTGSNVYIVHRGTEYVHQLQIGDNNAEETNNDWSFRESEPELEIEMLSRLMIYLGLQQEEVDQQLANVKMFKPRARLEFDSDEKSPFMVLLDPYQIAWNRVYHQLLRMNYKIESSEFKSGLSNEGVITVETEVVETDTDSGFFGLFSSQQSEMKKFTLVLSEETHEVTRVNLEDRKGNFDTSPEGAAFLELLYEQLK